MRVHLDHVPSNSEICAIRSFVWKMKWLSLVGFAAMVAAVLCLWRTRSLFAATPWGIGLQFSAVLLMIWARVAFGMRSFHAGANPTAGGLVTSGPYRFIRHPIYAAICVFVWAGVFGYLSLTSLSLGVLATAGAIARLICEERLVLQRYPEYHAYGLTTKRLLPGVW
jgi:protein-S-isoprenylcysteine O-methyltransferase Ste14